MKSLSLWKYTLKYMGYFKMDKNIAKAAQYTTHCKTNIQRYMRRRLLETCAAFT